MMRLAILLNVVVLLIFQIPASTAQTLDETWTVRVGSQISQANSDGSFRIANIASPDLFGSSGPGSVPDSVGDDFLRVVANSTVGGMARWAYSDLFQIRQGETFSITLLTFSDTPPQLPTSITLSAPNTVLRPADTTQFTVTATLIGGEERNVTSRGSGTSYRTSNVEIARVDSQGRLTANTIGTAFITAVNEGTTSVIRIDVTEEILQTTIVGFVELADGEAVPGADVTITPVGRSTTTNAGGRFSIEVDLPRFERVAVNARAIIDGADHLGVLSDPSLVADGLTDAGVIVVSQTGVCRTSADCDDGSVCNGVERCSPQGACVMGTPLCAEPFQCIEATQACVCPTGMECCEDDDCDDGVFCNGPETCTAHGACALGEPPCCFALAECDEDSDKCISCRTTADCRVAEGACREVTCEDDGRRCVGHGCDRDLFCPGFTTCPDCANWDSCGWCDGRCVRGVASGPSTGTCETWINSCRECP